MHNYEFSIGDYRRDTQHLTQLEHGIYRSMIDSYYLQEGPFTEPLAEIMRKHNIRTQEEVAAFNLVVADFFYESACGYLVHDGCTKRLDKIYARSDAARKSAEKRWEKKIEREKNSGGEIRQADIFEFKGKK